MIWLESAQCIKYFIECYPFLADSKKESGPQAKGYSSCDLCAPSLNLSVFSRVARSDGTRMRRRCRRLSRKRKVTDRRRESLQPRQMNRRHHAAGAPATKFNRREFKRQEPRVAGQRFALFLSQCSSGMAGKHQQFLFILVV